MSDNSSTIKSSFVYSEAPASWNTRYLSPDGFVCQITLRGESGKELLDKAAVAMAHLLEIGCSPCDTNNPRSKPNGANQSNSNKEQQPPSNGTAQEKKECPIHHVEMRRFEKDGRAWYAHKTDNGWCNGKKK